MYIFKKKKCNYKGTNDPLAVYTFNKTKKNKKIYGSNNGRSKRFSKN